MPAAPAAPAAPVGGFQLPDLGPAPNPEDPQYADAPGKAKYQVDAAEYAHKQEIHQNFADLDAMFTKLHPHRNFQQEYEEQVAAQKQHEGEREKPEGWKRGLLALGDMNPAVQQSGRSGLGEYDQNLAARNARADNSFAARMILKQKMHEGNAEQAQAEGNWKLALKEKEAAAQAEITNTHLTHAQEMERTGAIIAGQNQRAKMRADTMYQSAMLRAQSMTSHMNQSTANIFMKEIAKHLASRGLDGKDLTKTYDPIDLDTLSNEFQDIADRVQHPGAAHNQPAAKAPAKAAGAKEDF
jgi:hypothetical protein